MHEEQINAGVELLNRQLGFNWPSQLSTSELDMNNVSSCILGQLYGSYYDGCQTLWPEASAQGDRATQVQNDYGITTFAQEDLASAHGFNLPSSYDERADADEAFGALKAEWVTKIQELVS